MNNSHLVLYEEEFNKISYICQRLGRLSNARAVVLIDKNGQFITSHGAVNDIDMTSLASLTAGSVAATGGLARLIGEEEFSDVHHEGIREGLQITVVAQRAILVILYDKKDSKIGLIRLRVKKSKEELEQVFADIISKADKGTETPFSEITEEDIDNLFS